MSFSLESIKKNKEEVDKEVLISKDEIIENFYESVRQNISNEKFENSLQNLLIQNIQNCKAPYITICFDINESGSKPYLSIEDNQIYLVSNDKYLNENRRFFVLRNANFENLDYINIFSECINIIKTKLNDLGLHCELSKGIINYFDKSYYYANSPVSPYQKVNYDFSNSKFANKIVNYALKKHYRNITECAIDIFIDLDKTFNK